MGIFAIAVILGLIIGGLIVALVVSIADHDKKLRDELTNKKEK